MPIKAIIIDDERLARNELKKLLEQHPEIEIIDEAISEDNKLKQYKSNIPKQNIELQGDILGYKYNL